MELWKILLSLIWMSLTKGQVDGKKVTSEEDIQDEPGSSNLTGGHNPSLSSSQSKYSSSGYHGSAPSYYTYPMVQPVPLYGYNYNPYASELLNERSGKDFSIRSSNHIPVNSHYAFAGSDLELNGLAASASQGHSQTHTQNSGGNQHHGHGHGHGWGWGWPKAHGGGGGGGGNSALGALGLIGLLSLLTSVLRNLTTTTTTTARTGRKRRDATQEISPIEEEIQRTNEISLMVLPALNVVAHARNREIPLECAQREICRMNQVLVQQLGVQGRHVGSMMSSAIIKMLREVDKDEVVEKSLLKAGMAGRNGEKCDVLYPLCGHLEKRGHPLPLLIQPSHLQQFGISPSSPNVIH